jgi:hypothetical protein
MKLTVDGRLKQQMLDRGMTAPEIEQVLKAGSHEFKSKWHEKGSPPVRKPELGRRASSKLPA